MTQVVHILGIVLLLANVARAQDPSVGIPPVERKPYSAGGILEARSALVWFDANAASFKPRPWSDGTADLRGGQFNSRLQLDAAYRRGWFSGQTRSVLERGYSNGDWTGDATAYEAYLSVKPAPSLTVDAGKRTFKWGKGYLWTPAAFLDRAKSPEDPALALEGFVGLSADYIRTFGGPLQVLSVTPVVVPVYGDLNAGFGERGHLNAAGKLYLLLYDTDLDVMFLAGGSRAGRFGFDVSRNLRSNLEVHGEWMRIADATTPVLDPDGVLESRTQPTTSLVVGLRYLTERNITFIVDYFWNGTGYTSDQMETYFEFVERASEAFTVNGDDRLLTLARRASEAGYGRLSPMRNYVYGRVTQPDALGVLYLTLGGSSIVNVDDGSVALLPEVQYKAMENLELRLLANVQRGAARTEFGEKQANLRLELRVRYYF